MARALRRLAPLAAALCVLLAGAVVGRAATAGPPSPYPPIHYRHCRSVGKPWAGRLVRGTRLPPQGRDFFTWDPVRRRAPNRWWRRYSCDFTIRKLLRVLSSFRRAFPDAPRVGIGDLSRPHGGPFGERFGGLGHGSHQNGRDVDVFYPRLDGLERAPRSVDDVDLDLAQELVNRFVRAGAQYVFVGPDTDLTGPRRVVQPLVFHNEHMHVRFRVPRSRR